MTPSCGWACASSHALRYSGISAIATHHQNDRRRPQAVRTNGGPGCGPGLAARLFSRLGTIDDSRANRPSVPADKLESTVCGKQVVDPRAIGQTGRCGSGRDSNASRNRGPTRPDSGGAQCDSSSPTRSRPTFTLAPLIRMPLVLPRSRTTISPCSRVGSNGDATAATSETASQDGCRPTTTIVLVDKCLGPRRGPRVARHF